MAKTSSASITRVNGSHLIIEELRDEIVVFDRRTNKAHMLNTRAAAIYRAAKTGCSMDDLTGLVEGKTTEQKRAAAQLGVMDLERAGLLTSDMKPMPRRGLLKTLGTVAALPMVISILAPTPAAAASNLALAAACVFGDTCAGGDCRTDDGTVAITAESGFCCPVNASATGNMRVGAGAANAACTGTDDCCTGACTGPTVTVFGMTYSTCV